jgi:serine/threonine-protein kinase
LLKRRGDLTIRAAFSIMRLVWRSCAMPFGYPKVVIIQLRNEMGRMFGSTRFMAPEEFELGALIDERTNVFVMGRTALVFLSDGTLNADAFRGTRALFEVVARACEPERSSRYDSMAAFCSAWRASRAV